MGSLSDAEEQSARSIQGIEDGGTAAICCATEHAGIGKRPQNEHGNLQG